MTSNDGYRQTIADLLREASLSPSSFRLQVTSGSMSPILRVGDFVIARPTPLKELHRGDLIVVWRDGVLVTHRLIAVDERGWHTKGDRHRWPDPPVPASAILGRVESIQRPNTTLDLLSLRWRLVNRLMGVFGSLEAFAVKVFATLKAGGVQPPLA